MPHWMRQWAARYALLPQYFTSIAKRWQDYLWGPSIIAVAMVLIFALGHLPTWAIVLYFVFVLFVAGYFAWRADHMRLMPKLAIAGIHIQRSPNVDMTTHKRVGDSIWIQLETECLTDANVEDCLGHLIRILHKPLYEGASGAWEDTEMNESLPLGWSLENNGHAPIILRPGVPKRLNIFSINKDQPVITPCVQPQPLRMWNVVTQRGQFLFEIRITAKDCAPIDVDVECEMGEAWNEPKVRIISNQAGKL